VGGCDGFEVVEFATHGGHSLAWFNQDQDACHG